MKEWICVESPNEVDGGMLVRKCELIRCKDCAANADTVPPCPLIIKPGPDGYCSFAVRKENE